MTLALDHGCKALNQTNKLIQIVNFIEKKGIISEIDNDAYCVCTHNFSPCRHRNIRPVRTMYAVKISGTQTVYDLMHTQIKIPLKLSQNDNLSTSIVRLLCQQLKSSYNMNAASDRFILHTMQTIMYLQ